MMDVFIELLQKSGFDFIHRAIAREIRSLLDAAKPAGSLRIDVPDWSINWGLDPKAIWLVIDHFESQGFWMTASDEHSEPMLKLSSHGLASSARQKRDKSKVINKIKDAAREDRSFSLRLSSVSSSSAEISLKIPKEERKTLLERGYCGWLPTLHFGLDGLAFKPDEGLISALSTEFPDSCVHSCLVEMFGDLRQARKRPDLPNMPFWIRQWMAKHGGKIQRSKTDDEIAALINDKLDEY